MSDYASYLLERYMYKSAGRNNIALQTPNKEHGNKYFYYQSIYTLIYIPYANSGVLKPFSFTIVALYITHFYALQYIYHLIYVPYAAANVLLYCLYTVYIFYYFLFSWKSIPSVFAALNINGYRTLRSGCKIFLCILTVYWRCLLCFPFWILRGGARESSLYYTSAAEVL